MTTVLNKAVFGGSPTVPNRDALVCCNRDRAVQLISSSNVEPTGPLPLAKDLSDGLKDFRECVVLPCEKLTTNGPWTLEILDPLVSVRSKEPVNECATHFDTLQ
ncbi:3-hydroxyisobutyrate dehydrogenase [Anopheles sinensis]|uniref:3-hydroxyisobutyrate dehydrogenase n=1 Tax=Anopheles sinensis TaxID=74873 RepID=A0A084VLQ6_ANOSI|nr:3-hydroxyisobutyrate dehydrogenase [Anopheles sinensis]